MNDRALLPAQHIHPQRVFTELSSRLPERCILTGDAGTLANWHARDIRMRRGAMGPLANTLASFGSATPYALAAKMAFPDRLVIAFIGYDTMQMNGLNVMTTIAKYWGEWSDPRLIVMVRNSRVLSQATWEERVQRDQGKSEATQQESDFPYHRCAELLGLKGIFVDDPERLGTAWDDALSADRPVLLECYTDPDVSPLPSHITAEDAKSFLTMTSSESALGSVL